MLLTCEHATRSVPAFAQAMVERYLSPRERQAWRCALASHRGWDPGALEVMQRLARLHPCVAIAATASRLLIDVNRSPTNARRYSSFTRAWPRGAREELAATLFVPHWQRVASVLKGASRTLHVALHSFEPRLAPGREHIDIGILYDPSRPPERQMADALCAAFAEVAPHLRLRRNAPYRGVADGLPTALRRRLSPNAYVGFEIEMSQQLVRSKAWPMTHKRIASAICCAIASERWPISPSRCAQTEAPTK